MNGIWQAVKHDFYGNALYDFNKVPGSILSREKRKMGACTSLDAVYLTVQLHIREGVNLDINGLSRLHML